MADLIRDLVVAGLLSGTQPITIMGLLLLRTGHDGRRNSVAFLAGAFAVETACSSSPRPWLSAERCRADSDPGSVFLGVRILIGITLVVTGLMLRRPAKKESPEVPKSLQRLRNLSLGGAFVAGVLLADYVGPVLASLSIASTDVDTAGRLASIGFYTILATGIPAALLIISLQSERAGTRLDDSISWLMNHRRQIASWITLVLGVLLVANGIIGLIVVGNQ